jgi:hypothetical protein
MNERVDLSACDRSPRAFARYRTLVLEWNRTPVSVREDIDLTEAEDTWCDLTTCESVVFGIDPRLLNALVLAAMRY